MSTSPVNPGTDSNPLKSPLLFAKVLESRQRNTATYRPAKVDEKAPGLGEFAEIEKPGQAGADTIRYVTKDGDHVIVSKSTSPDLFKRLEAIQGQVEGVNQSLAEGYALAAGDAKVPETLNEKLIGPPGEVGEGLIRYVDADGKKVIVSEQDNPALFKQLSEDFKALSGINASEKDGYVRAGGDEKTPDKLTDIRAVGPEDEVGPGLIRFETQDGKKVVVSKRDNPALFEFAKNAREQIQGKEKSSDDGYRVAGDNETWPPFGGTTIGPPDEMGPNLIRYEHNGEKVVVAREDNPKLYDHLVGMYKVMTDPGKKSALEGALNGGAVLDDANAPLPGLNDISDLSWQEGEQDSVLSYKTQDGQWHVVSKDIAPEQFKQVQQVSETWAKIHDSEAQGYKLAGPNDFIKNQDSQIGSPDELGDGLIRYENADGKFIVSKDISPQLYEDVLARWTGATEGDVDSTRSSHNLPPRDDLDVLNLGTGEHADPDDPKSAELNVSELATQKLIEGYRKGVEDGSIAKDDPRAKLVRALEAQAAYSNGHGITGYEETPGAFGGTWREFSDGQTELTSADMHDIIDGPKLKEAISELFSDPTIAKDYKDQMSAAIDKLPNKDEIKQKLLDMVGEHRYEYVAYLNDLKKQGKVTEAQEDLSNTLTSLAMFDPDAATKAAQDIQADGLTTDLNELVGNPSKISEDNKELATKDLFGLLKSVLKGDAIDLPRRVQESIDKFLQEGFKDKKKAEAVTKALEELGDAYKNKGSISQADIDTALSKSYVPIADRGTLGAIFSGLNTKGILGSLGAGVSLFSGIYQLVGDGGKLGETPEQRLAIAKDFLFFAGASGQFVRAGDAVAGLMGKGGVVDLLGLDKSLPEIWGKEGVQGKQIDFKTGEVPAELRTRIEAALENVPSYTKDFNTLLGDGAGSADEAAKIGQSISQRIEGAGVSAGKAAKIAGSVIKVLGPATDIVGGFADIVLGAFTIKSGVKSNDPLVKAQGGLQIAAGAFGASAGVVGAAALIGAGSAAALTGPFFLVGVVLAVVGGIIGYFVDHNKKQKATEKENDWYRDLAADGLLQDNWGDKVEYAHYSIYHYGGREAPEDDSLFRFQQSEWQHFDETPQKGGSSSNRLDESLHKDENGIVGYNTNGTAMNEYGKAFYEKNKETLDYIHSRWDDWNGSDKIVSDKDLRKIAAGGDEKDKNAAQFLLDNKGFFDMLDTFWKRDGADGKLSTDDLEAYLKLVGGMELKEGDEVFYDPEYTDGKKFGE
ncbi:MULTISPECIES: hypothetical protein [unclassified Pseudomonas]|uniref:hypothetical protein n=1 Tax=unclassified Pseudomonas TaxID=196821 RepID=UPI000BC9F538|nr:MULTISPECIES: hypothetical protein [unclassified Pseudomonas]PVZ12521.1 hypothetical protein F474_03318 [Pseudomonas sp. URIL14HWK12:I12]PVZ23327.1 hypothetical protein F470_02884 [Pseudomonas sp. URIL14HWK12:I10]PVZ32657.1 hypothetical protein F472_03232 [Pseudomonas sp. URIL14HWK12:I11]SNZ13811.1 hypothetical protein SAMN05660463_02581 [Pseudomonas sp. URIL14HWK12:I9]